MNATLEQKVKPATQRKIKKVAILGSGVMGSRIACHFANIGLQVLLFDIVPNKLTDAEAAKGLTLDTKAVRNRKSLCQPYPNRQFRRQYVVD